MKIEAIQITIPTDYLIHIFQKLVLLATIIVIIGDNIYQVYTDGQVTGGYTTQSLITIITLASTRVSTKRLAIYFWQNIRLIINLVSLALFFRRLKDLFFLIKLLVFLIVSIHFSDTDKKLECSFRFSFNGFIKHFVVKV